VDLEEELLVRLVEEQHHQLAIIQVEAVAVLVEMELQQADQVVPVSSSSHTHHKNSRSIHRTHKYF
jgi:hypothetical protein